MDKCIGIIVATPEELKELKNIMTESKEYKIFNLDFYKGKINNKNYVLVQCGVGKVNAARTTQILIDKFDIESVINVGVAGGLEEDINIGDIVIGEKLVQHDFDITAFGHEKGYITEIGKIFESDKSLIEKCKKIKIENLKIIVGTIASGDIFCTDTKMKEKIKNKFNSSCVEMEGAAIAQTAYLCNVPFLVIRAISDIPNGKNKMDYEEFAEKAAKNCAKFIEQL